MASAAAPRKTVSIYDYPEHLNPFHEDDNHNKIRFWTIGKRLTRTNSFTGLKDLKNSWAFRSFMRKGKKGQDVNLKESAVKDNRTNHMNGENSPIVFRRALQCSSISRSGDRSTVGSPDRYVYGGSVTPLPRSRFQERLRSASQQEVGVTGTPRMARSEVSGSRLSVESTNPFDAPPVPPVRASRRKKKRAPAPPPAPAAPDVSVSSENSELIITETEDTKPVITELDDLKPATAKLEDDLELEEIPTNIELKIVEDEDDKVNHKTEETETKETVNIKETKTLESTSNNHLKETDSVRETNATETTPINHLTSTVVVSRTQRRDEENNKIKTTGSEDDILNSVSFPKIDIVKYRRNSSVNDDDIRLRRGNLEDFHTLSTKRSKSLTNTADASFIAYDINLNENIITRDQNSNEEPQKVVCKMYDNPRKPSNDDSISSTEREFLEIEKVRKEFESEIKKLNAALAEDDFSSLGSRKSVSEIRRQFDKCDITSPNPIPKPKRSNPGSPLNGNIPTPLSSL